MRLFCLAAVVDDEPGGGGNGQAQALAESLYPDGQFVAPAILRQFVAVISHGRAFAASVAVAHTAEFYLVVIPLAHGEFPCYNHAFAVGRPDAAVSLVHNGNP